MARISVKYFRWSRRVRVLSSRNVKDSAKGLATSKGRSNRWALRWSARVSLRPWSAKQPGQRLPPSLELMDGPGLLAVLIDRQHEAAVQ